MTNGRRSVGRRGAAPLLCAVFLLSACGGSHGSGGSEVVPTPSEIDPMIALTCPPATATVTSGGTSVSLAVGPSCGPVGASLHVAWSVTNATKCTASGAWGGDRPLSGSATSTPSTPGVSFYGLTCAGPGGDVVARVPVDVSPPGTIPPPKSSYEGKAGAGAVLGPQPLPRELLLGNAVAFADFFQEGKLSMVTHDLRYTFGDASTATRWGHIHFYQRSSSGAWVDHTAMLLGDDVGCLHPRKAVVADFNGDGRPDVAFACHGFDGTPFPGEAPHVLLSQPGGTYANTRLPVSGFIHGVSAADVNGDGYPDLLLTDAFIVPHPYFLLNNGDGTFTRDDTRLPPSLEGAPIFSAELVDFGGVGRYDVFLAGNEQGAPVAPATIYPNDGAGRFVTTTPVVLPGLTGYGLALDLVYTGGEIYLVRTIDASTDFYGGAAIQRISYPALRSSPLYTHLGGYANGTSWINWIIPFQSQVTTTDSMYRVSVAQ